MLDTELARCFLAEPVTVEPESAVEAGGDPVAVAATAEAVAASVSAAVVVPPGLESEPGLMAGARVGSVLGENVGSGLHADMVSVILCGGEGDEDWTEEDVEASEFILDFKFGSGASEESCSCIEGAKVAMWRLCGNKRGGGVRTNMEKEDKGSFSLGAKSVSRRWISWVLTSAEKVKGRAKSDNV